jgi:hypothetical protein
MAEPKIDDRNFKWENVRSHLARAITFTRSRAVASGLSGTTLESSLAEAIVDVDSAQVSPITSLGEGDTYVEEPEGVDSGVRKGSLQKVEDLITLYYGDDNTEGLFDQLKGLAAPDV